MVWNASSGATSYEVARASAGAGFATLTTTPATNYVDSTASAGKTFVYKVRAINATGPSAYTVPDIVTTIAFTDDPLVAGTTVVKAVHLTELRSGVNAVRAAAGLSLATFTDPTLSNPIIIKAVHVQQLRSAVTPARTALGLGASSFTDPTLTAGTTSVRAIHIGELRGSVKPIAVPPSQASINILPPAATVQSGATQQFTASVSGASNTAVAWTATGGTVSPAGLYTAGVSAGSFTVTARSVEYPSMSASATITITTASLAAHPRIILDAPTLATLRARAQANSQEWTALKSVCDSFIGGGTVNFIGEDGYPDPPNVGEGYQGSGYVAALMPLGLCYQTTLISNPTAATNYATKAVAILMAMSDPAHQTDPGDNNIVVWDRDSGYGIRNFGVAMGIGYDWFHDRLTPAQMAQLQTALNNWFTGWENDPSDFEYADPPQGNYFAGYYAAKCMAALAVQGDSSLGDTWWNDWYNHQHLQRVQPYYLANLGGGGWLEGFAQYGILASELQSLPALAVRTAKGVDLIHGAQPYPFPLDQAQYLMAFTWPSRDIIDDRGELYSTGDPNYWPGTGSVDIYRFYAGFLAMWSDPAAPMMHKYARDAKTALDAINAGGTTEWIDFLFWDPNAPETTDYSSLPLSYMAPGIAEVSARSDWSTTATFMSFLSGPYINFPGAGHEHFEKGSIAIERNRNPFLVNDAWFSHEPNGDAGTNAIYDDRFGNWDADHTLGNRVLYNTFQVRHLDGQGVILDNYGQFAELRDDGARTRIGRYEDGGSYVLSVGQFLEDMYRPLQTICAGQSPVTSWSRQIVYLRPSRFVVYDRTTICDASLDQYLAFHFPASPVEVTAPGPGVHRFDVTNAGVFAGSMTTILPASPSIITTDHLTPDTLTWNKMWRTEIRATGTAAVTHQWLNVFDASTPASQVATATGVSITSGAAVGALLQSATGNSVVVSGTAPVGTAIAGTLGYTVPAAQTRHVITDLVPSSGYTISVLAGGNHVVTITGGGSSMTSANGVLTFQVSASGQVTP